MNESKATVDFETRSACSLKKSGAWKYSLDPSTQILCLVYRLPHWKPGVTQLWHPAFPQCGMLEGFNGESLLELIDWIEWGGPLEAYNVFFERAIWTNILTPKYDFPLPAWDQWRCSAAKAAAHALPRSLTDAGAALNLKLQKDDAGHKLMMKISKPRKSRKKERETWAKNHIKPPKYLWWEDRDLFERLFAYCRQDVLSEEALSEYLEDLNDLETRYYCLDQKINQRGFYLDIPGIRTALQLIHGEVHRLNGELADLTEGQVQKATQRTKLKKWLDTQDVHLFDTKGSTIDELLSQNDDAEKEADELPPWVDKLNPSARRALEILRMLGRSSTAKYETMLAWACPDGRVRGGLLYHGATTGRWSGAGVQPHNFPKGTIKKFNMDHAWDVILSGDRHRILAEYPSVMETLACALRGAIIAPEGKQLYVADYAAIEARVLMWMAREKDGLRLFREGKNLYIDMAQAIFPGREITKESKIEYPVGKTSILGLGYGMGPGKFVSAVKTITGLDIDEVFAEEVVATYRNKYAEVKSFWYKTEECAVAAVLHPGTVIHQDRLLWQQIGDFLFCTLPSGRRLSYPYPELRDKETPWGDMRPELTFMGVDVYTHQWKRQHTYGGKLVENVIQAVSRDLMAYALQASEDSGIYHPILSVHDEIIAEAELGTGSIKEFETLLATPPAWAKGCPIAAEGWVGTRYRK